MPHQDVTERTREALIVLWEAADRIGGKRRKAVRPSRIAALDTHGHLALDPTVRPRLLAASPATSDRLVAAVRSTASSRTKRTQATKPTTQVPGGTFADWNEPVPGYREIDGVAHGGSSLQGNFRWRLGATASSSGWTEAVPLLAPAQALVVDGLEVLRRQFPIPVPGIDAAHDNAFMNDPLLAYGHEQRLVFTRSRAYPKNDQAWIEHKNGAVVRRCVGYDRRAGVVAGPCLA